ncbi:hypothetical protein GCM10017708_06080 [Arthrobacter citreus]
MGPRHYVLTIRRESQSSRPESRPTCVPASTLFNGLFSGLIPGRKTERDTRIYRGGTVRYLFGYSYDQHFNHESRRTGVLDPAALVP